MQRCDKLWQCCFQSEHIHLLLSLSSPGAAGAKANAKFMELGYIILCWLYFLYLTTSWQSQIYGIQIYYTLALILISRQTQIYGAQIS